MAHVVFAAPTVERFHLHDQLSRRLARRGHRVTVLAGDSVSAGYYAAQGLVTRELRPGPRHDHPRIPFDEFARHDCRLAGKPMPSERLLDRTVGNLAARSGPILRLLETDTPDLVFFHAARSGLHRLFHFIAREFGCALLHTGDGLVPFTMQWSGDGIDGDGAWCRRIAKDYRQAPGDSDFLQSALSAALGRARPPALAPRHVSAPAWPQQLRGLLKSAHDGRGRVAWSELTASRRNPWGPLETASTVNLPSGPFLCVLLQRKDDPRTRLDCESPPTPLELLAAAHRASQALDASMPIVAVLPPGGIGRAERFRLATLPGTIVAEANDAALTAATAAGVITVNHPTAVIGLLAHTPVLYLGRTPYGIAGIASKTTRDTMVDDLQNALLLPSNDTLRERFLTRVLMFDHVWCDATRPDANGMRGLVQAIEQRVEKVQRETVPPYRAGPVWPLR